MFVNQETAEYVEAAGIPDNDELAFKDRTITNRQLRIFLDQQVTEWKADGTWDRMSQIYPMLGKNRAADLKSPDSKASITYKSDGIIFG